MSNSNAGTLHLFDVYTFQEVATPTLYGQDVAFPDFVRGWSDVLDSRVEPYTQQSIEEICRFAQHVHKKYILVTQAQARRGALPQAP